jgi:hypothetical protein
MGVKLAFTGGVRAEPIAGIYICPFSTSNMKESKLIPGGTG